MKNSSGKQTEDISNKVHHLIHQIYQTTRTLNKSINRALYSTNIYGSEWSIIRAIKHKGTMTQTALSCYLNIEPAAISKTLRQLAEKNLIVRKPGEDRREKYIYLSEEAEDNYHRWEALITENCIKISNTITDAQYDELYKLLHSIQENLDLDED